MATTDKKSTFLIIFLFIVCILTLALNVYVLFFKKPDAGPNRALVEYLEAQRRPIDSIEQVYARQLEAVHINLQGYMVADSARNASLQATLKNSINQINHQYEKIPRYTDLGSDSLRRLFAKQFATP